MNNNQLKKIEKELKKTHYLFKKNKVSNAKIKNLVSFTKGLTPEQLIIFIAKFIIGVSATVHRKGLARMINDSLDIDNANVLIEILDIDTTDTMKVKDLLVN